ncbi:hypothetical protein BDN72DRAFT_894171 [Pluteus cervinus]|uniref:Uncharacterized protein n=1 Tax=Pluteus cervinus TaxID=181527 RepID=A0ACD3B466_9AGAR|nr:hypothetical protein BDN72DRAFT_894171 [Pluteus cervinus]
MNWHWPRAQASGSGSVSQTSSAVSRALHIADIVHEVLERLCPPILTLSDYRVFITTRKHFLHTALTCRIFLEPSLDILWRFMHSILPLLKLLPPEDFQFANNEYVLSGPPLDDAPVIGIAYNTTDEGSKSSIMTLNHSPPSHSRFTSAMHFHTTFLPPFFHALTPFASAASAQPMIQNMVDSLLSCLRGKAHHIRSLSIGGVCPSQVPQLAGYFKGLVYLDLSHTLLAGGVFQSTLRKLANLPSMKSVRLNLGGDMDIRHHRQETIWSTSIEHVTLIGSVSQVAAFLNSNELPHIRDICLDFPSAYAGSIPPGPRRRLVHLQANTITGGFSLVGANQIYPHAFREILGFLTVLNQLQRLHIEPEAPSVALTSLASTDYWELANAFPALEKLALPPGNVITVDTLYKVAFLCPRLHTLAVGIDTETIPALPSSQYPAIAHNLKVLSVGTSGLNNVHLVTRHLHQLFPRLETVLTGNPAWNTVQDLLKLHRSMVVDSLDRRVVTSEFVNNLKAEYAPSRPKKKRVNVGRKMKNTG